MERGEEDVLLLERILLLIRNLLFIPSNPEDEKVDAIVLNYVTCT